MIRPFVTEFQAIDPKDGTLKKWCGQEVWAESIEEAQNWCNENAGHLLVLGELISEIPCKEGTFDPDFSKEINYSMLHERGFHISDN